MVVDELTDDDVNRIFRALADTTRRDIVRRTLVEEISVSQLADLYAMSFAAVQKPPPPRGNWTGRLEVNWLDMDWAPRDGKIERRSPRKHVQNPPPPRGN